MQPPFYYINHLPNFSMGMSMVREAAVHTFMERIERLVPSSIDAHGRGGVKKRGWLELRKGFYTFLEENGDLFVYRTGVLHDPTNRRSRPNTTDSENFRTSGSDSGGRKRIVLRNAEEIDGGELGSDNSKLREFIYITNTLTFRVRSWHIKVSRISNPLRTVDITLPRVSDINHEKLMTGEFLYLLEGNKKFCAGSEEELLRSDLLGLVLAEEKRSQAIFEDKSTGDKEVSVL